MIHRRFTNYERSRILAQKNRWYRIVVLPGFVSAIIPLLVFLTNDFEWINLDYAPEPYAFAWHFLMASCVAASIIWTVTLSWMIFSPSHYPNQDIEAERWIGRQFKFALVIPLVAMVLNIAPVVAWVLFG